MDYTNDACMNMFSAGQSTRMNALFASGGSRVSLLSSNGCLPVSTTCSVPAGLTSSSITSSGATLGWTTVSGAASYNVQYRIVGAASWTATTSTTNSKAITGLTASSNYEYQVQTVCSGGTSAFSASGAFTTSATTTTCTVPSGLASSAITSSGATLGWTSIASILSYNIRYRVVGAATWITTTSTTNSKSLTGLTAASNYEFQIQTVCSSALLSAFSASATFTTLSSTTSCISTYDNSTNGALSGAAVVPFNTNVTGLINTTTDIDYYKFTITTAGTITISLSTLPADFDLALLNSAGTQLTSSANASTTSESITYTVAAGTSYYAKVFGYSSALSTSSCYTLKVQLGTATRQDIAGLQNDNIVSIAPNPVKEKLVLSLRNKISSSSTYSIIDTKGVVLKEQKLITNPQSIDVSNLNKGFYIIKINNGGVITTQKFIKQ